jgi:hypothetical protein
VILGVKRVSMDDGVSEQAEPPLAMELRDGVYLELGHVVAYMLTSNMRCTHLVLYLSLPNWVLN